MGSLKVYGNAKVILYEHVNYGGASISFTSNDSNLRNNNLRGANAWNNDASSLKLRCPEPSVNRTTLSFGNLYDNDIDGAPSYNDGRAVNFTLSNTSADTAAGGRKLLWEITRADCNTQLFADGRPNGRYAKGRSSNNHRNRPSNKPGGRQRFFYH